MLAIAFWIVPGSLAFAKGGGGHGGGGHGGGGHGGGHSGGHHSSSHHTGGYHHGGYYYGGHHHGYYNGFWPGYYGSYGYGYYPGYGYGYYGTGYSYPFYNYGYPYSTYGYSPAYVSQGPATYASPIQGRYLGIDEMAVIDGGVLGMQVTQVYPGSPAERAGLQAGDVIHSANGYLTQAHGNLTWIISSLPADGVLQMSVRTARDGAEHVISARIP
jgi:hypothetical protein